MTDDVGAYCRSVEAALMRAMDGPLARITGPDFAAVEAWIGDEIPLSVVERAIDETADRQRRIGGRGQRVRIRVAFLDRDVRRIEDVRRRQLGPGAWRAGAITGRVRNCPRGLGGCGALERGADDHCVHCGWKEGAAP